MPELLNALITVASLLSVTSVLLGFVKWLIRRREDRGMENKRIQTRISNKTVFTKKDEAWLISRYRKILDIEKWDENSLNKFLSEFGEIRKVHPNKYVQLRMNLEKALDEYDDLSDKIRNYESHPGREKKITNNAVKKAYQQQLQKLFQTTTNLKGEQHIYKEPPKTFSKLTQLLPKELRDRFKDELTDFVKDGIAEKKESKTAKGLFIISETFNLAMMVGKLKLFGFVLRRKKTVQPPP